MQNFIQRVLGNVKQKAHITFGQFVGGFAPPAMNAQDQLRAYKGWTYSAVTAIAEAVANVNVRLLQLKNGELIEVADSPILDLIFRVNPFQSKSGFLQLHQTYMELAGESFWFLERGTENPQANDPVKELWLLRPDLVDVIPDPTNFIKGYTYRAGGKSLSFMPWEIIHFKKPNPINPYRGLSPVQAAAIAVDTEKFSSEWNRNFFFNSARPDAVIETEQALGDEQWGRLKKEWESNYGGTHNAHRVAVLEQGLKFNAISLSQKDMDFMRLKQMTRDEIFGIWRVPKTVLGITEDVTVSNAEATDFIFGSRVVKPKMQELVDHLNEFLVPMFGEDLILDFDDPTPENREKVINEYVQGHNRWLSINDIRVNEGLEPISGGDAIYQPLVLFPVGTPQGTEQRSYIKIEAPRAVDIKKAKRVGLLKTQLLNRNKKLKRRELLRRRLELMQDEKRKAKMDELKAREGKEQADLITELVQAEQQRDFYKAQSATQDNELKTLKEKLAVAEATAEEALDLKNDGQTNKNTEGAKTKAGK